jgi:hypothetical protein
MKVHEVDCMKFSSPSLLYSYHTEENFENLLQSTTHG